MVRFFVLSIMAVLFASCAFRRDNVFVPRPAPTLADPPSVSQAELSRYLKK